MSQGNDAIAELSRQWSRLAQALLQRHERGVAAAAEFEAATGTENERHERTVAQIRDRRDDICRRAQDRFAGLERTAREAHAAERGGLQAKAQETEEEIQRRFERQHREARDDYRQALWLAESVHEAGENGPRIQLEERRAEVGERRAALEQLVEQARRQTRRYRQRPPQVPPAAPGEPSAQSLMQLSAAMLAAQQAYAGLRRQRVAGLFRGPILLVPTLMLAASAAVAALRSSSRNTTANARFARPRTSSIGIVRRPTLAGSRCWRPSSPSARRAVRNWVASFPSARRASSEACRRRWPRPPPNGTAS
ncbi:MAG: hypothetical protein ACO32J_07430 [Phycisphaerales bacterium]